MKNHRENGLTLFEEAVQDIAEIVECYTVSGDRDFLLRVVVADVSAYEQLLKHVLINLPGVDNLSSTFALRQVKYTTEYPLGAMRTLVFELDQLHAFLNTRRRTCTDHALDAP